MNYVLAALSQHKDMILILMPLDAAIRMDSTGEIFFDTVSVCAKHQSTSDELVSWWFVISSSLLLLWRVLQDVVIDIGIHSSDKNGAGSDSRPWTFWVNCSIGALAINDIQSCLAMTWWYLMTERPWHCNAKDGGVRLLCWWKRRSRWSQRVWGDWDFRN